MELEYFNKNNITIIQKRIRNSDLSYLLSWETTYLNNDIKIINYDKSENIINCMIFYNDEFHSCKLNTNIYNLETASSELKIKLEPIKLKSFNLQEYFENISIYLNLVNEKHDKYIIQAKQIPDINIKNIDFIWNPYLNLHIENKYNFNILELKHKANELYVTNGFDCQNLHITKEHIIDIIFKELQALDNNDKFTLIIKDNIFDFDILFKTFTNEELNNQLDNLNIEGIKMNIKLNSNLYPYFPPNISFKHKLNNNLDIAISKLSYFTPNDWNPTNTLYNMTSGIHKILNEHASLGFIINEKYEEFESLIQNIINTNNISLANSTFSNIKLDYIKVNQNTECSQDSKYWNSGIGYGHSGQNKWNINKFIEEKNVKNSQTLFLINSLYENIFSIEKDNDFHNFIINSNLFNVLLYFIEQFNLVEIETNYDVFKNVYNILFQLDIISWCELPNYELDLLIKYIKPLHDELIVFMKINIDIHLDKKILYDKIIEFYNNINSHNKSDTDNINIDEYCNEMKKYQFEGNGITFHKYYYKDLNKNGPPSKACISKLTKELATYSNALPMNIGSSIYVRYDSNNLQNIKALITGPKDTPYENGCYIFDIYIPSNYPLVPPKVNLQTTGYGKVRFNPNLYNCGKVCLSLLGTWKGEAGETWNPNTSTLLQVLVSIQSLIFVENPYFNEPGYEKTMHTPQGKNQNFKYNDERRLENIKWAINNNIKGAEPEFKDVIMNHFKFKKNEIKETINEWYSVTNLQKDNFNSIKNNCLQLLEDI